MKPKVSVIIPCYNQEKLIIKALESIPKRDDIEIIVIDDGSTDKSEKVVSEYIKNKKNIRLIRNIANKGVGFTVNRGYDLARGEYIVLLGSDDYFYTEEFEKCINELDGTDLIYFNLQTNNGEILRVTPETKKIFCGSVKFMRRDFISTTRCPEDIKAGEDWYFYDKLLKKNPTEKYTNITVKHYNFPRKNSLSWKATRGEL